MQHNSHTFDRRSVLVGGVTLFGGMCLAGSRTRAQDKARAEALRGERRLLLVELSGGNDGLSTIVPVLDDVYHRSRTRCGVDPKATLKLDDTRGFHPNLGNLRKLFDEGRFAIVEGTGYPQPNHSHFTSQDIWHTARASGRSSGDGWIGRMMAELYPQDVRSPHCVHVGQTMPYSLQSSTHPIVCFDSPPAYRWASNADAIADIGQKGAAMSSASPLAQIRSIVRNAKSSSLEVRRAAANYQPKVEYPASDIAQDLKVAAALLQGGVDVRVMSVTHQGYDTHEDQKRRHDILMRELDGALSAFFNDVRGTEVGDNTLVLVFSEFGRRVEDNASVGTDHGTAGPMFLLGTKVQGGLYGKHPSLQDLYEGDLKHTTDFRSVYASVLRDWMKVDSEKILGAKYEPIAGMIQT
jgi:uncharacterized protein (DUF1501 family)